MHCAADRCWDLTACSVIFAMMMMVVVVAGLRGVRLLNYGIPGSLVCSYC